MNIASAARLFLRLAHALAAVAWLGGGAYYVLALRPQLKHGGGDEAARALARDAQRQFGEWASIATLLLIVTGVILMYDQLSNGKGTLAYVLMLVVKVGAALIAFWLAGSFGRRRARRVRPARANVPVAPAGWRRALIDRAWLILTLGSVAFLLGIVLSSLYPTGIGQR